LNPGVYEADANQFDAVYAIRDGRTFGLKPGEYEWVDCNGDSLTDQPTLMAPNTAEIRRYDLVLQELPDGMTTQLIEYENKDGQYVLWADHLAAMKANMKLISDNETFLHKEYSKKIAALKQRVADCESGIYQNRIVKQLAAENTCLQDKVIELSQSSMQRRIELQMAEIATLESQLHASKQEIERIRHVAEKLRDSDDENEISMDMNTAGEYMLKVLNGENFS
jgi:hypothetical protein